MGLSDLVNVVITKQDASLTRVGFGTLLIAGYHTNFATRTKSYSPATALADMITDGFTTDHPMYLAAAAALSQNPRISALKLGRRATAWTKEWKVIVKTAANSTKYTVTINGEAAEFTSDATATKAEISAGLKAAIDLLGEPVTVVDDLTDTLTITADVAGVYFTIEVTDPIDGRHLWIEDTTTDPGIVADITAIQAADPDWYGLIIDSNGPAEVAALAVYIETQQKIFGATVADTEILDVGVTNDIASTLDAANYVRTFPMYRDSEHSMGAAAWMGRMLPFDPGSATWSYKTLVGQTADPLTDTEVGVLDDKTCNYYVEISGRSVTQTGITPGSEWIDVTRGLDWLRQRIAEDVFVTIAAADKIPYTDPGATILEAAVQSRLRDAVVNGVLAADPEPTTTVPKVADQSVTDRQNRYFPDLQFSGTLAGAIHTVEIEGSISV
ncbi:MAG: DUF3383 domain-containing protein [Desulfuromonadales bacterium]|nr:DUF3383 domain-containing protein [Desulfuromonadales bacterium]